MTLKALIVDDEYPSRQELRYIIDSFNNVEVIGEAAGATEALKLIQALEYDILFLDINMPGINGLDLAAKLQMMPKSPNVIFITAYDQYAVQAFDVGAQDYILKPFNRERIKRAVDKIVVRYPSEKLDKKVSKRLSTKPDEERGFDSKSNRLVAETGGKMLLVDEADIYFAFSRDDTVFLKTDSGNLQTRYSLKNLEARISKRNFIRTHRSYIVNMNYVNEIKPFFNGTLILLLKDKEKTEIPVSRSQAKKIREMFK